jgi:ribosome-associated translation inhibitor RaiA
MTGKRSLQISGAANSIEEQRIRRQLAGLDKRLVHHPEPSIVLVLDHSPEQRRVEADLRLQLGPLGGHLVSRKAAETADQAVRLAVEAIERQLERRTAGQRGEPTFGVPSRRLPRQLRPNPPGESDVTDEVEES